MAYVYHGAHRPAVQDADFVEERSYTIDRGVGLAERIVTFVGGLIIAVLGLRFILSLLGANRANAFASLIYTLSHPFVAPFFGLFNYREQFGVSRFEIETLIAMAFWALVAWGITYLLSLGRRRRTVY
jgi:hypothetical protein